MNQKTQHLIPWLLIACILSIASPSQGANYKLYPAIALSEEYNDNIFLTRSNKQRDFITRIMPSIAITYDSPRAIADINYLLDYRYFAKGTQSDEFAHNVNATGQLEVVKELIFFKVSEWYGRTSTDFTKDYTRESLFYRQSDSNIFTANPYAVLRLSPTASFVTGYLYTNVWYKDPSLIAKSDHTVYAEIWKDLSSNATAYVGASYTKEETEANDFTSTDVYIGTNYNYAKGSFLSLKVGNSWIDFKGGDRYPQLFWDVGILHDFTVLTAYANASLRYNENPGGNPAREKNYTAGGQTTFARTYVDLRGFLSEYDDTVTRELSYKKYGVGSTVRYDITPKTAGIIDLVVDRIEYELNDTYTRRYFLSARVDHLLQSDLAVIFEYRYSDYSSPKVEADNFKNNRFIVEVRKSF